MWTLRIGAKALNGLCLVAALCFAILSISKDLLAGEQPVAAELHGEGPESRPADLNPESHPSPSEKISLRVNLPATRLDLYVNDKFDRSYDVAIGMPKYPTPIRDYNISYIVWNPWWIPPDSDWAQDAEKTPPGPGNPLGAVKLLMEDGIRIHGTNAPRSIGRAASHACLRMRSDDVKELAWTIQQAYSDKNDPSLLDKYKKNPRSTFWITLFEGVPVSVQYSQVEIRGDKVFIYPDRYSKGGLEQELETALAKHPEISVNKTLLAKIKKLRSKGTIETTYQELTQWSLGDASSPMPDAPTSKKS